MEDSGPITQPVPSWKDRVDATLEGHTQKIGELNSAVFGVRDCGGLVKDVGDLADAVKELLKSNAQQQVWNKVMGVVATAAVIAMVGILVSILTHTVHIP